jgi:DNA-binding MarR family transcriptional regulator
MAGADPHGLRDIGLLFRSINFTFRQEMDRALRKARIGASFGEISPMLTLLLYPGSNGAELARRALVSAQAMNTVLMKLVAKKYVERRAHPHSLRADSWHLTDKGSTLLERAKPVFEATTSRMLSGLSSQEVKNLEKYLRSCSAALESAAAD